MRIVADENIPAIENYFGGNGELILKPGRFITRDDLLSADMLLVRSVTKVNYDLLHDTPVKFVGSVTTGLDHLDVAWLEQEGIRWSAAQGCNTTAVVEYVISVAALLQTKSILPIKKLRAAVVGVGRVGSQVVEKLKILGFDVVLCDPLRAEVENDFVSTPIESLEDMDLITLHTPLTEGGSYPTYHMVNKKILQNQKKNCVFLNTSRGSVIDFSDLKEYGQQLYWCLDVWENEPYVDFEVLELAEISTPHIAGYSIQSKFRGIEMLYYAARQLGLLSEKSIEPVEFPKTSISFHQANVSWQDVVLKIFNLQAMTDLMKQTLLEDNSEKVFDVLRKNFNERYEFKYVSIEDAIMREEDREILKQLGL